MLLNFYALRALSDEWSGGGPESLIGAIVEESWSSSPDELTIRFTLPDGAEAALRISVKPGKSYVFRQIGSGKPRKNTTPLFRGIAGQRVTGIRVAERDRVLHVDTAGGATLTSYLFGSSANVILKSRDGDLLEAFRAKAAARSLPESRPAPDPDGPEALQARWPAGAQPLAKAVNRAVPLLDRWLAQEVADRAALEASDACLVVDADFARLYAALESVRADLVKPRPTIYRDDRAPVALSLVPLQTPPGTPDFFETVDDAVRMYVRSTLAERGFRSRYDPLLAAVEQAAVKAGQGLAAMQREIGRPSRADQYEIWGHLLMASEAGAAAGRKTVTLPNLFADGEPVVIPLDEALSGLENANRLYDRARRSRRAREEAERRVEAAGEWARETDHLLEELRKIEDGRQLKTFLKNHETVIGRIRGGSGKAQSGVPFRTYVLESGHVVWVGRNARQNDVLTFKHASKHDLWLHARGVAGSHTVLRRNDKTRMPPPFVVEQAASIAAFHSKARGSALVPVIVTERKYVRSPRNAHPGSVLVDREEVLLVKPGLPEDAD